MRYSKETIGKALDMVQSGETLPSVCKALGLKYNTVYQWCRRNGVEFIEAPKGVTSGSRAPSKMHERCPKCGALKSHWNDRAAQKLDDVSLIGKHGCHNVSGMNPADVFTCSGCGLSFNVSEVREDGDGVIDIENVFEFVPKHCPNCGRKVFEEEG